MNEITGKGQMKRRTTLVSYTTGFVLSLALTLAAYFSVVNRVLEGTVLVAVVVGLAVAQLLVQLVFFLHIGSESRPRLNLVAFVFMLGVVGIVVIGSLWIMHNLDYRMSSHEMNNYLLQDEGIHH